MPNLFSGAEIAKEPATGQVGTTSSVVVAYNYNRVGLTIVNISDGTIYLGVGNTATLCAGMALIPGAVFNMEDYSYSKDAFTAIGHSSSMILAIQEWSQA